MVRHGIDLSSHEIQQFCRKWKIRKLSVFGSILGDEFRSDSDIDFLAEFDEDEQWGLIDDVHMRDELRVIAGRDVDLMSRDALLTGGNRRFQREVLGTAEPVYVSG